MATSISTAPSITETTKAIRLMRGLRICLPPDCVLGYFHHPQSACRNATAPPILPTSLLSLAAWFVARSFNPADLIFDPESSTVHPTTVKVRSFLNLNLNELALVLAHTPWAQLHSTDFLQLSPNHPRLQLTKRLLECVDSYELLSIINFLTKTPPAQSRHESIYSSTYYIMITTQYKRTSDKIKRCLTLLRRVLYSMTILTSRGVLWTALLQPVDFNPLLHVHDHNHYTKNVVNGFLRRYKPMHHDRFPLLLTHSQIPALPENPD
jgi:hypothetical protein